MSKLQTEDMKSISLGIKDEFKLDFKLNTIIMLVGPDGSGKTEFAVDHLMRQISFSEIGKKDLKIGYISLDFILDELLHKDKFSRQAFETNQVLKEAYSIAFSKLRAITSYPVNFDFIIIDSDGLDPDFRAEILKIGEENHYNVSAVVFNYKDKSQYSPAIAPATGNVIISIPGQMKKFKQVVSGGISKKEYSSYFEITDRKFYSYKVLLEDYLLYEQYMLQDDTDYIIIGDVHGCINEFKLLLEKNGFVIDGLKVTHPQGKAVILVGDIIDKGYAIPEVIEFVYENLDSFYLVMGNHESLVYKKLSGTLKKGGLPQSDVVAEFFNTIDLLGEPQRPIKPHEPKDNSDMDAVAKYDELFLDYSKRLEEYFSIPDSEFERRKVLREKFLAIAESMKSFYVHKNFIVTHAPCDKKYLGKLSSAALKATRDFRYPKQRDYAFFAEFVFAFDEKIKPFKDEASDFHPIHVFGHVTTKEMSRYKNKIDIDTACATGGKLTSIQIDDKRQVTFKEVESGVDKVEHKQLYNFFS